jgi:hypothetical protein
VRLSVASAGSSDGGVQSRYHVPLYNLLANFSGSKEKEAISLVVLKVMSAQERPSSYAALLHEAIWGDPTAVFLPRDPRTPMTLVSVGGFVVVALVIGGALWLFARRDLARGAGVALAFGLGYALALVTPILVAPYMILTKTNFILPLALPIGIALAVGLGALPGRVRTAARAAVVVVAAGGVALTWYGWWMPRQPPATAVQAPRSALPAARTVERYFAYRANDPIRAAHLLAPETHVAHELRLVRILRVPLPPERGLAAEDERALEVARGRHAWLELYNLVKWMQPGAAAIDAAIVDVTQEGDTAEVRVRIAPPATTSAGTPDFARQFPPFEQRFSLRRDDTDWRITHISQSGVSSENAVPAFAASPTLAALDELRRLGWRPDWEDAIASALGSAR